MNKEQLKNIGRLIKKIIDTIVPPLKKIKGLPAWILTVLGIVGAIISALIIFL